MDFDRRVEAMLQLLTAFENRMAELIDAVLSGGMSVADWQLEMRDEIRRMDALMLIAGHGGTMPDPSDWLVLGTEVRSQYLYLEQFARDLAAHDPHTLSTARSRARMYARSSQSIFWQEAMPVDLPAKPGDGTTRCLSNCNCSWEFEYIEDGDGEVVMALAFWVMHEGEHCPDCEARAAEWNPLRIPVTSRMTVNR